MANGVSSIPVCGDILRFDRAASGAAPAVLAMPSFLAGRENRLAAVAIDSVISNQPARSHLLMLVGPPAVGKSHLARGLVRHWQAAERPASALAVSCSDFARELARAISQERTQAFRECYRSVELLVLEDLGQLSKTSSVQQELISTLDALERTSAVVVVTSRAFPNEIPGLVPALRSRLAAGLVIPLVYPEADARAAILTELTGALGIRLSSDAVSLLASRVGGGVPRMFELLAELGTGNQPVSAEQVRRALADNAAAPTIPIIAAAAAKHFSLRPSQLRGASRNRTVCRARAVAMYLARSVGSHSLEKIGRWFGGRDHTTVLYNCRKIADHLTRDTVLRCSLGKLESELRRLVVPVDTHMVENLSPKRP